MLIYQNAEGVHGQTKFGNPWARRFKTLLLQSGGVALNVWFTTNGMWAKKNNIYMWREQAIIEWLQRMISIIAWCHRAKLCAHADFRSQQNGAVTRMWRSCCVKSAQKECAIGAVRCENEGMLLQPLRWRCVECVIHHERDVREEQ